jgi:uncharacterized membrane protein
MSGRTAPAGSKAHAERDTDEVHMRGTLSDTTRAVAFSDAVFAIIITLLVLDLKPPEVEPGRLWWGLLQQWPTYLAYLTSYLYVAVVWLNHKSAFTHIRTMDRRLHWANLLVLFGTALLPFPTAVISAASREYNPSDEAVAVALYALIGALLCIAWLIFFRYLSRHPELLNSLLEERFFARESTRAWVGILGYAAAGVLGYFVAPPIALVIFIALPIFYGLTSHGLESIPALPRRR